MIYRSLCWSSHISTIVAKATKTLNFLKRNLSNCSRKVKKLAYLTMVRPLMEYASAVWDPYYNSKIQLEKVCRAAQWIYNDYSRFSSVSAMVSKLSWPFLETHRKISRLQVLHKALYHQLAISIPLTINESNQIIPPITMPSSSTRSYQNSYFSRTIKEWNTLPLNIIDTSDSDLFTSLLQSHYCTSL